MVLSVLNPAMTRADSNLPDLHKKADIHMKMRHKILKNFATLMTIDKDIDDNVLINIIKQADEELETYEQEIHEEIENGLKQLKDVKMKNNFVILFKVDKHINDEEDDFELQANGGDENNDESQTIQAEKNGETKINIGEQNNADTQVLVNEEENDGETQNNNGEQNNGELQINDEDEIQEDQVNGEDDSDEDDDEDDEDDELSEEMKQMYNEELADTLRRIRIEYAACLKILIGGILSEQ